MARHSFDAKTAAAVLAEQVLEPNGDEGFAKTATAVLASEFNVDVSKTSNRLSVMVSTYIFAKTAVAVLASEFNVDDSKPSKRPSVITNKQFLPRQRPLSWQQASFSTTFLQRLFPFIGSFTFPNVNLNEHLSFSSVSLICHCRSIASIIELCEAECGLLIGILYRPLHR